MNKLSRSEAFAVSGAAVPCTNGINIADSLVPLPSFDPSDCSDSDCLVGIVDVEGQGDQGVRALHWLCRAPGAHGPLCTITRFVPPRLAFASQTAHDKSRDPCAGVEYDVQLLAPLLLVSKVVIFNWKGAPCKEDMLQKLYVMTQAAERINPDESESPDAKIFGHLRVVRSRP